MLPVSSSENSKRRIPEEKGPFGKARKRGVSRSKTPNISSAHDLAKQENLKHIDDIFAQYKADDRQKSLRKTSTPQAPASASAPNLLEAAGPSAPFQAGASTSGVRIPKEVMLYGFGKDQQWAAIAKFEEISGGTIYEEYERQPSDPRYGLNFGASRPADFSKLSTSQIAKINEYVGGDHWVKVTFDSAEAADRAIHWGSPHTIWGYEVYAEAYRGVGPTHGDRPIPAGTTSLAASPNTVSSATIPGSTTQSSATASSATATIPAPTTQRTPRLRTGEWDEAFDDETPTDAPETSGQLGSTSQEPTLAQTTSSQPRQIGRSTLRIKGRAVRVGRFQDSQVFLPTRSKWQETLGQFPIIGWIVGSGNGLIGDQVPRDANGRFDHTNASLYWRTWYMVDACFGTDFCGVKEIEYED
jgi:hypothetical protein